MANNLQILILAAGKGTRMNSDLPKVLHKVIEIPMIDHVIGKASLLRPKSITIMVNENLIFLKKKYLKLKFLIQEPQLGTAHAVQIFQKQNKDKNSKLLVLYADNPLVNIDDLKKIKKELNKNDVVILGFEEMNNSSYGIIVEKKGSVDEIVEFKDATKEQRKGQTCNSGIVALSSRSLNLVSKIKNNNIKKNFIRYKIY